MRALITSCTLFLATLLPAQGGRPKPRAPEPPRAERPEPGRFGPVDERMRERIRDLREQRREELRDRGERWRTGHRMLPPGMRLLLLRRLHARLHGASGERPLRRDDARRDPPGGPERGRRIRA